MAVAPTFLSASALHGSVESDAGASAAAGREGWPFVWDSYLPPAVRNAHFHQWTDEHVLAVLVSWYHVPTGRVVFLPDPSYKPSDPEVWLDTRVPGWEIGIPPPSLPLPPIEDIVIEVSIGYTDPLVRHGFKSHLNEGEFAPQVMVYWRHLLSGEVVEVPDPSWGPPDPENWEVAYDPGAFESEPSVPAPPPVDREPPGVDDTPPGKDGPVDGEPPPSHDTEPRPTDPVAADLELVAYHWKSRAVIEKTAWRVAEDLQPLVGQPPPRMFRPVLEETTDGGRVLGVRMNAREGQATGPDTDPSVTRVDDPGVAGEVATTPDAAAVNLRDAVAILRMIAGKPVGGDAPASSPFQSIAADFDGDGVVGLGDALGVLRHAVGRGGAAPAWAFVDEAAPELPGRAGLHPGLLPEMSGRLDAARGKVGLVAVLRGDVDGSWAPAQALERLPDAWFSDLAARLGARAHDGGVDVAQWGVYPG